MSDKGLPLRQQDDENRSALFAALEMGELAISEGRVTDYSPTMLDEIEGLARGQQMQFRPPHNPVPYWI